MFDPISSNLYRRRKGPGTKRCLASRQLPLRIRPRRTDASRHAHDLCGLHLGDRHSRARTGIRLVARAAERAHRLGGEEFAAILPGANLATAGASAEAVRTAFATSAAVIDGMQVAGTVSIGAASHDDINCDLGTLFHRADGALYAAKNAGRNRVELLGPQEAARRDDAGLMGRPTPAKQDGQGHPHLEQWGNTRRYRQSQSLASLTPRSRRGGPALS